ncbi:MAG: invasion associated locus B family protein [Hyphomicrobiaceae bacterium]
MKRIDNVMGWGRAVQCTIGAIATAAVISMVFGAGDPAAAQKSKNKNAKKRPQSAWVKLCEKAKVPQRGKDGKRTTVERDICLTHHERLDGSTGRVIVSAAIRQVAGQKKPSLMVMVPLGMAIQPGLKAAVYSAKQWKLAQQKKPVNDKELKAIGLRYNLCHIGGCTAEIIAPDGLVDSMRKGGGLMVLALAANGRPAAFPIPLTGFTAALKGKPVDNKAYSKARAQLMGQIRERMRQRIAAQRAKQNAKATKKN